MIIFFVHLGLVCFVVACVLILVHCLYGTQYVTDIVQPVVKSESPAPGIIDHHQWCSSGGTTTQRYQLTSPSLQFTGQQQAAPASSVVPSSATFTTIQLNPAAIVEHQQASTTDNHINTDGTDAEQHGVWQQL